MLGALCAMALTPALSQDPDLLLGDLSERPNHTAYEISYTSTGGLEERLRADARRLRPD